MRPALHLALALFVLCPIAVAGDAPAAAPPGGPQAVKIGKPEGVYHVFVPPAHDGLRSLPLVVALHGANTTAEKAILPWIELAKSRGWIVVAPQARGLRWLDADGDIVQAAVEDCRTKYRVDPDRICLAGLSSGGLMATRWGLGGLRRFACIFAHSGVQLPADLKSAGKVPVMLSCGEKDEFMEETRNSDAALRKAGFDTELAAWPGETEEKTPPAVFGRAYSFFEERLGRPAIRLARCIRARKDKRWADAASDCAALLGEGIERKIRLDAENEKRAIEYAGLDLLKKAVNRAHREPVEGKKDLAALARAFTGFETGERAKEALREIDPGDGRGPDTKPAEPQPEEPDPEDAKPEEPGPEDPGPDGPPPDGPPPKDPAPK